MGPMGQSQSHDAMFGRVRRVGAPGAKSVISLIALSLLPLLAEGYCFRRHFMFYNCLQEHLW